MWDKMSNSVVDVFDDESGGDLNYAALQAVDLNDLSNLEGLSSLDEFCANMKFNNSFIFNGNDPVYRLLETSVTNAAEQPVGEQQDFRSSDHGILYFFFCSVLQSDCSFYQIGH